MRMDIADKIVLRFVAQLESAAAEHLPESRIRWLRDAIRDALHTAVAAEREACAEIAENRAICDLIAAAIRSRGVKGSQRKQVEESPTPS